MWVGNIVPSISGLYRFYITGDDWCNVFIWNLVQLNKNNLALNYLLRVRTTQELSISLTSNTTYDIIIAYGEKSGGQSITFGWKYPGNNTRQYRLDRNELLFQFCV